MLAGATHIDHVNMPRAGPTQRVLRFTMMASRIGTFLRSPTFGHIRQLDVVLSCTLGLNEPRIDPWGWAMGCLLDWVFVPVWARVEVVVRGIWVWP
jgi:hypothetical protein